MNPFKPEYFPIAVNCTDPEGKTFTLTVTGIADNGKIQYERSDNVTEEEKEMPLMAMLIASIIGDAFKKVTIMFTDVPSEDIFSKENHITGKGGEA